MDEAIIAITQHQPHQTEGTVHVEFDDECDIYEEW